MLVRLFLALALASPLAAAEIRFRDAAAAWGVEVRHHHGGSGAFYMVETMGSGVAVFDYDYDGDRDLFIVDSGVLPGYEGEPPRSRLLRNEASSAGVRFVEVTERAGIAVRGYGQGATVGDVDGDGDLDLYVTAFGVNQLFVNRGDGTFADGTAAAGVGDPLWSSSAAFGDADGDGDLDLYVANYVDFALDNNPVCGVKERGLRSYCHPDVYRGLPDRFYRNRGDGTFEDFTAAAGIAEEAPGVPRLGKGLGVVFADLDGDGTADVYVANDMTPNFQFQGRGDGTFEELAVLTGTAVSDLGHEEAGMGIGLGDYDGNGHPDLIVTHLDLQTNAVYANSGSGIFVDRRFASKLGEPSIKKVGFGTALLDLDHDGDLDLAIANGHIIHNVEQWGTGTTYKQQNQVFENLGDGRFRELENGAGMAAVRSSRGLAAGDLDGDGDLDLVITNSDDVAEVYENRTDGAGWLQLDLLGAGANTAAIGALVVVEAEGVPAQRRQVHTGGSYQSHNDLTLHFGLGSARRAAEIEVRWPGGRIQRLRGVEANRRIRLPPLRDARR